MRTFFLFFLFGSLSVIISCDGSGPSVIASTGDTDLSIGTDINCSSSHSKVGTTGLFSTFAHSVSGTLTIVDDCTIEITGFNYDGGGPQVYFYAGTNANYQNSSAFRFSKLLTGTSFSNNSITLVIPANKTLDDFNSLAVWCVDFNANFGDVVF